MELVKLTVEEFIKEVSSQSPAPGGGSVSALAGANAAALGHMVCVLTIAAEKYQDVAEEFKMYEGKLAGYQEKLSRAIDLDTNAFNQVMAAFRMPKETKEEKAIRSRAIQDAYAQAVQIPLIVMETCGEILQLLPVIAGKGNQNALSDAGVAAQMAMAGLEGAALNVRINLPSLKDEMQKQGLSNKLDGLRAEGKACFQQVEEILFARL